MSELANILLVSRAVISDEKRILMVRRSRDDSRNPGLWEFPGGKVDVGETITQSLVREVKEETGLLVRPTSSSVHIEQEMITSGKYEGRLYVALFYAAQKLGGDLQLSGEHDEAEWVVPQLATELDLTKESGHALKSFLPRKG